MMSLWDALRMNMMISYQELVRTFPNIFCLFDKPAGAVFSNRGSLDVQTYKNRVSEHDNEAS
ncbi:hypothetical protein, partial [Enterobacter roggenkampii]|uniref:hypothetical protein n=1 Tax=Enterobacter roggenkampii TaxID=1812935 RepID=UPI002074E44E